MTYTVIGADGSTANYVVTVSVAAIDAKAITVTLTSDLSVTSQIATFSVTGTSVEAGGSFQTSGQTSNDFTNPVAFIVTAADATTAVYTVTVNIAATSAKAITAFSIDGVDGTIDEAAKTIGVTLPSGTNVTALVATFTTTGASVKVEATVQTSGQMANNFTNPVAYTVTAIDGTTAVYATAVTVALPSGTNVTELVPIFTTTGASVKVGATTQVSGQTANNFSSSVKYTAPELFGGLFAIKTDGSLWAKGQNRYGELGTGDTKSTDWTQVLTGVEQVAMTYSHSLALKSDGTIWGTGNNTNGELGTGDTISKTSWTQVFSTK